MPWKKKTKTPTKSKIDTQNDGFLDVSPRSNMAMLGIYVRFQGGISSL